MISDLLVRAPVDNDDSQIAYKLSVQYTDSKHLLELMHASASSICPELPHRWYHRVMRWVVTS